MARKTTVVALTANTVTRLDVAGDTDGIAMQQVTYYVPATAVEVWLGDQNVTVGGGIRLAPGATGNEQLPPGCGAWAIAASASQVNVDQVGV